MNLQNLSLSVKCSCIKMCLGREAVTPSWTDKELEAGKVIDEQYTVMTRQISKSRT